MFELNVSRRGRFSGSTRENSRSFRASIITTTTTTKQHPAASRLLSFSFVLFPLQHVVLHVHFGPTDELLCLAISQKSVFKPAVARLATGEVGKSKSREVGFSGFSGLGASKEAKFCSLLQICCHAASLARLDELNPSRASGLN